MGCCSYKGSNNQQGSKSIANQSELLVTNEYRWFWNSSDDPWDKTNTNHIWSPYPLDIHDTIELAYQNHLPAADIADFTIQFDSKQHVQVHKINKWQKRPVIRQNPSKLSKMIRVERVELNQTVKLIPYENNTISHLEIFCYSQLFQHFNVDTSDSFVADLTSHVTLLDRDIISYLLKTYTRYLCDYHHLKNCVFTFQSIKDILSKDLKHLKLNGQLESYVKHYVNNLSKMNFNETIIQMYVEEGYLYKNLNKAFRGLTFEGNEEVIFYLLCLLFVYSQRQQSIMGDVVVYRGTTVPENLYDKYKSHTYLPKTVIINYDFMSTSKSLSTAMNFIQFGRNPKKILFEISLESERNDHPYLSFKPFDIEKVSQYGSTESEILLPPNGVFEVTDFIEKANEGYALIRMKYRTNLYKDCISFISTEREIQRKLGMYIGTQDVPEEDFPKIISLILKQIEEIGKIEKMANLRELKTNFKDKDKKEGIKILSNLIQNLKSLQLLDLECNFMEADLMKLFAVDLHLLTKLQILNVSNNDLLVEGILALSPKLKYLTNLEELNIRENGIEVAGMKELSQQFQYLTRLRVLNLGWNMLGDEGIVVFSSQLHYLVNLTNLNLDFNGFGDEGITELASKLPILENLEVLDIDQNLSVTNDGLMKFLNTLVMLTKLQKLVLSFADEDMPYPFLSKIFHYWNRGEGGVYSRVSDFPIEFKNEIFFEQFVKSNVYYTNEAIHFKEISLDLLGNLNYYQKVKHLSFDGCSFGIEGMKLLCSQIEIFTELIELNINNNNFEIEGMQSLCGKIQYMPNLQILEIAKNSIEDQGLITLAAHLHQLKNLQKLNLKGNFITDEGIKHFAQELHYLTELQELNLDLNQIMAEGMRELSCKFCHLKLKTFAIQMNPFGAEGMTALAENFKYLRNPEKFYLETNKIGNVGMKALASNLQYMTSLQEIGLVNNQIEHEGISEFSLHLQYLSNLQSLNLTGNSIGDKGMKALSQNLKFLGKLTILKLECNKIGDEGMKAFALGLGGISKLERLYLRTNYIGNEGLKAFSLQVYQLKNLNTLDLENNRIGNEGLLAVTEQLHHLENLRNIKLTENQIDEHLLESFLKEK